jgi:leucyl-tRNA synthetase
MNPKYEPRAIEAAVQAAWSAADVYRVSEDPKKKKFYACSMLPYPSGKLHMGHVRNYTINDVMLRYLRMNGYNVLMPMGWDAFGLPAENAAIDRKVAPAEWTYANIADMKSQMQPLGLAFDWSRELATCKPDYYKWNQWLFLKMLEKGVAYRKTQIVNWDPIDQTVLANEQVIDGRGWRSGAVVEKREIPGYYLGITQYAEELLSAVTDESDPNYLKGWPDQVRAMQANWIGKSTGVRFAFPHEIKDADGKLIGDGKMYVFTTRADTIMGVTFVAVAPEHPLAVRAGQLIPALAAKIEALKQGGTTEAELATKDKEGVATGLFVKHPLTGEKVEVWVGNYVLMTYGDGAVMGVPGHDERDFAFALKYNLPIKQVLKHILEGSPPVEKRKSSGDPSADFYSFDDRQWKEWYADKQAVLCNNSGRYNGLNHEEAVNAVAADLAAKGLGEKKTTFRLRDWGISRQRYWGTPIPIIHCPEHGAVPVPEKDLPVVLPEDCLPDGSGNPLNKREDFLKAACPICGKDSRRETDTMDTFVDSSWYFMRYACPDAPTMVDARNDYWMPMDQYIGGIEHAVLHLLYARFWTKVMRDMKLLKYSEPFTNLFTQGMLLNECFYREGADGKKQWFYPSEVDVQFDDKGKPVSATAKADGQPVMLGGIEKMSKSKNNVVEPKDIIAKFGADTARTFVMFAGPPDQSAAWSDSGAEGAFRFLRRLWDFCAQEQSAIARSLTTAAAAELDAGLKKIRFEIHSVLKAATNDYQRLQYNTVVSAAMKMLNALQDMFETQRASNHVADAVLAESVSILLRTLYPIAPHVTTQLWSDLGYEKRHGPLLDAPWPQPDPAALEQSEITLVVQVNGKLRGEIVVPKDAAKEAIESAALANENVHKFTSGLSVKKIVIVPGKLVNVVVA